MASLRIGRIRLLSILLLVCLLLLLSRVARARQLKNARHVYQLADEGALVREVVDVIVFELEEAGGAGLLVDDDRQDQAGVQLGRRIEVDLSEEPTEAGDGARVPLHLLPEAVDLELRLSQGEVDGENVIGKDLREDANPALQLLIERLEVVLVELK